jgi:hypothetical protein
MKAKHIDFGTFVRPDNSVSRLTMDVSESGRFSIHSMVTPHEGTLVATGEFKEYIKGLPDLAVETISRRKKIAALEDALHKALTHVDRNTEEGRKLLSIAIRALNQ